MLKTILYWMIFATTAVRVADIAYLFGISGTDLPAPVLAVTLAMIMYGIFLLVRKLFGNVTLKQLMAFYMVQTVMVLFNLAYLSIKSPLRVSLAETVVVGTFLDVLVNCCVIYFCTKQLRSHYFAVAQPVVPSNRHG